MGKYQACTHGKFHVMCYIGHHGFRESLKACFELEMSMLYMLSDVAKGVAQVHFFLQPFFIGTRYGPRAKRDEFVKRRLQVPSFRRAWYVCRQHSIIYRGEESNPPKPSNCTLYHHFCLWRSLFYTLTWLENQECYRSYHRDFSCCRRAA